MAYMIGGTRQHAIREIEARRDDTRASYVQSTGDLRARRILAERPDCRSCESKLEQTGKGNSDDRERSFVSRIEDQSVPGFQVHQRRDARARRRREVAKGQRKVSTHKASLLKLGAFGGSN
jgi:hypothetical protein